MFKKMSMSYGGKIFKCLVLVFFGATIVSCNGDEGKPSLTSVEYNVFLLKNYEEAIFVVPNPEGLRARCDRLSDPAAITFQKELNPARDFSTFEQDCKIAGNWSCKDMDLRGQLSTKQHWGRLRAPLFTLEEWGKVYPQFPIQINAMFFEVEFLPSWPHIMPCTNLLGYAKASDGTVIGNPSPSYPLDYLVIGKPKAGKQPKTLVWTTEMTDEIKYNSEAVISGFIAVKSGLFVYKERSPRSLPQFKFLGAHQVKNARAMIGFRGNDMLFFLSANIDKTFGATLEQIARIAIDEYGVTDAFALDSGGSVSLFAKNPVTGEMIYKSPPLDKQGYRPLPSIIGIIPKDFSQFSILVKDKISVLPKTAK